MEVLAADTALAAFFAGGQRLDYKKNAVILRLTPDSHDVYWIEEGFIDVRGYTNDGSVMSMHIYKHGEIFPVTNLFERRISNLYYTAYTDVVLRRASKRELLDYLERTPAAALAVVKQQTYIHDSVMNLHLDTAEKRVVRLLLDMVQRFGEKDGDHYRITLPFTQQQMADSINLSRETTGKILNQLETQGCIVKGRKHTIVYLDKLRSVQTSLE